VNNEPDSGQALHHRYICLPIDEARWIQHTLHDAAQLITWRHEPRHLHHDLNLHARRLQASLDHRATHTHTDKDPCP
jgi:hypothetical protein